VRGEERRGEGRRGGEKKELTSKPRGYPFRKKRLLQSRPSLRKEEEGVVSERV